MGQFIGKATAAFFGLLGIMCCIPGIFLLWIAGTIALKMEE